jgi:hypothetical protein
MATQVTGQLPPFENECFLISPIGDEGTEVRHRADGVRDFIVRPALEQFELVPVRADEIATPGQITLQVIEHVLSARAAIADISGANANVFYELAVRHTARLPVVLIAHEGDRNKLPFDIAQMRTIFYDHHDLKSAADCQAQIQGQLHEALERNAVDSPVVASVNLAHLQGGNPSEQVLAQLVSIVEGLSVEMSYAVRTISGLEDRVSVAGTSAIPPGAIRDLIQAAQQIQEIASATSNPHLIDAWARLSGPIGQITSRAVESEDPALRRQVRRDLRRRAVERAIAADESDSVKLNEETDFEGGD